MRNAFATYHPFVNFFYFLCVILLSMVIMHPAMLMITFIISIATCVLMKGKKGIRLALVMLPMLIIVAIINPLFNHEGMTILLYLNDNPITFEAVAYGLASAVMFVSVIIWFSCYNAVMTSDKFIYLFGKIIPAMSLIFSMVLRLVPRFTKQFKAINNAQQCIGKGNSGNGMVNNIKNAAHVTSILLSWGFENSIDTADSMKCRGYGLKGRTAYSNFRFDKRDLLMLTFMLINLLVVIIGLCNGQGTAKYFPLIIISSTNLLGIMTYICYSLLLAFPLIVNIMEEIRWLALKSKI